MSTTPTPEEVQTDLLLMVMAVCAHKAKMPQITVTKADLQAILNTHDVKHVIVPSGWTVWLEPKVSAESSRFVEQAKKIVKKYGEPEQPI